MKVLVIVSCVLAVAAATPGLVGAPIAYAAAPYAAAPYAAAPYAAAHYASAVVAPTVTSQFHAQDELGQYSYGYQGDTSAKQEVRTADGITRGGYSYLDANGIVQSTSYVSDPINGFRVAATNLPVGPAAPIAVAHAAPVTVAHAAPLAIGAPLPVADTPEVVAAKAAHFQAHAAARSALLGRKKRSPGLIAAPIAPVAAYHAPAITAYHVPAIVAPARSFAYSSITAHPSAILAAHHGAVVIA